MLSKSLKSLLDDITSFKFTSDIYFVGGTALQVNINHRISYDIDLAVTDYKLDKENIDKLVKHLESKGRTVKNMVSQSDIDDFINDGEDIYDYQQDYNVDGIKLTLFVFGSSDKEREILIKDKTRPLGNIKISSVDALFKMKSLVLIKRHKSRDMFDLYHLIKERGYSVNNIFENIKKYLPYSSIEIAKRRLSSGNMPFTDEGINSEEVGVEIEEIAEYFKKEISDLEKNKY